MRYHARMTALRTKPELILSRLAVLLTSGYLPVQEVIAAELGCDQPFISRATNGRLSRITKRVMDLRRYAVMRIRAERQAVRAEIDLSRELSSPKGRGAILHPVSGRRSGKAESRPEIVDDYADRALEGIRMYLNDGYDARLIVEQIAVLRRAQRVRVPGRRRAATLSVTAVST